MSRKPGTLRWNRSWRSGRRGQQLRRSQEDARTSAGQQEAADHTLRDQIAAPGAIERAVARLAEIEEQRDAEAASARAEVALTSAGEVALRGAALLLEEIEHVRTEASHGDRASALLQLGATPFVAQGYLPAHIAALAGGATPVRVQLTEGDIPTLVEGLGQGRLDAVVCALASVVGESSAAGLRYERRPFLADFALIAHKAHPLARRKRVKWDVLGRQRWILPPPASRLHSIVEAQFIGSGNPMPIAIVETGVPVTVVRMAAAGVGLAVVPMLTLSYLRAHGEVARIDAFPAMPGTEVGLVTRSGPENPRVALLRDVLANPHR